MAACRWLAAFWARILRQKGIECRRDPRRELRFYRKRLPVGAPLFPELSKILIRRSAELRVIEWNQCNRKARRWKRNRQLECALWRARTTDRLHEPVPLNR